MKRTRKKMKWMNERSCQQTMANDIPANASIEWPICFESQLAIYVACVFFVVFRFHSPVRILTLSNMIWYVDKAMKSTIYRILLVNQPINHTYMASVLCCLIAFYLCTAPHVSAMLTPIKQFSVQTNPNSCLDTCFNMFLQQNTTCESSWNQSSTQSAKLDNIRSETFKISAPIEATYEKTRFFVANIC